MQTRIVFAVDAKGYPYPFGDRYIFKCVTNIFPVVAKQSTENIEFKDFKNALNVLKSLELSLVV